MATYYNGQLEHPKRKKQRRVKTGKWDHVKVTPHEQLYPYKHGTSKERSELRQQIRGVKDRQELAQMMYGSAIKTHGKGDNNRKVTRGRSYKFVRKVAKPIVGKNKKTNESIIAVVRLDSFKKVFS